MLLPACLCLTLVMTDCLPAFLPGTPLTPTAAETPQKKATHFEGRDFTYAQFRDRIHAMGQALVDGGVQPLLCTLRRGALLRRDGLGART